MALNVTGFDRPTNIQVFLDDAPVTSVDGQGIFTPARSELCGYQYTRQAFFPLGIDLCKLSILSHSQWGLNSTSQVLDVVSGRTYALRVEALYAGCIQIPEVYANQLNGTAYNPISTLVTYCGGNYDSSLSNTLQVVAQ